jgi:hypothetical protein
MPPTQHTPRANQLHATADASALTETEALAAAGSTASVPGWPAGYVTYLWVLEQPIQDLHGSTPSRGHMTGGSVSEPDKLFTWRGGQGRLVVTTTRMTNWPGPGADLEVPKARGPASRRWRRQRTVN